MKKLALFTFTLMFALNITASEKDDLQATILALDAKFFSAFNKGDIETLRQFLHPGLEFYHDKSGLTNYQQTMDGLSELMSRDNRPHRRFIAEKSEIYPVPNFGAIQVGQHEFCNTENDVEHCGIFKFNHVWQNDKGLWRIKRIISYDH